MLLICSRPPLQGSGGRKNTWESAFKSGKLSTVAVLCLQAGRQTTFHLQELLSTRNRLGRLPLSPLATQLFENSRCFEAPLRLSASTGWLPSGSDWGYWGWVSCWHCWLSQVSSRFFCFTQISLWECLILWFHLGPRPDSKMLAVTSEVQTCGVRGKLEGQFFFLLPNIKANLFIRFCDTINLLKVTF